MTKLEQLERLATHVELELRAARREAKERTRRPRGRPGRVRGPDDHGTERDYQAETWIKKRYGGPPPCDLCKTAHALWERRRKQAVRRREMGPRGAERAALRENEARPTGARTPAASDHQPALPGRG